MSKFAVVRGSHTYLVTVMAALAVLGASVFFLGGGSPSNSASTTSTATSVPEKVERLGVDGYGAVALSVSSPTKPERNFCALLADTPEQQARGMMGRVDLGGYDAMIFPFQNDSTAKFFMANVPVPLSIAWFDAKGKFVSSTDMAPCGDDPAKCPTYGASGPYRTAIEVLQGGFPAMGIGTDSTISYGGPCI